MRLRIVGVLAGGGRCVCDLQEKVPVAANLLSYHLRVLRDAGLVAAARRGRWIDYRLDGDGFAALWAQASAAGVPCPASTSAPRGAGPRAMRRNGDQRQDRQDRRCGPARVSSGR